jgi:hypothetical protein
MHIRDIGKGLVSLVRFRLNDLAYLAITNAFLKTTLGNNVSVLDFIVHYLLHVSAQIGGNLQVKCTQNIY